ncbi:hypothetical protein [Chryseobacterium wangxinyae]|uniref:hypothetical protein n=1 Tax=Chryseobacterium sp. CY353 TaxID=2997334 RepID=UPI002271F158|nr:hypothetical protein [Chryseobacterium sp. CY353]MCY0970901.1 hypothetical protein [Chryseobacterium sp. CY353]
MELFFFTTIYLSYFFLFVAMICGIVKFKKLRDTEKWYTYYLIYTFLIEGAVTVSVDFLHATATDHIYPFYIGGVFFILTFLYLKKLNFQKIWLYLMPVLGLVYLVAQLFLNDLNHDYVKVISNIIIFGFAGLALLQEIRKTESDNRFLLADAFIFLYYAVSAFIFILHNKLGNMLISHAYLVWGINNILTCVLYSSFIYTFLRLKK